MRFNAYLDMQKSKKMMVSLCGLALSSLFVLNNKSVVHADTINDTNNQNNAISWNSDSDAAQNVQNTQNADDDQQNVQPAQLSRAETSTVRSVSAAPRTTNQSAAVQSPRVANVQDAGKTSPVVINNPAGDKVHVHYIDANGNAVENSSHDYDIDVAKTGQGSYTVPNGYSLNNPDGKYNVNGGTFSAAILKGNLEHYDAAYTYRIGNTPLAEFTSNPASINGLEGSYDKNIDEALSHIMVSNPDIGNTNAYYLVIADGKDEFSKYKPYKRSKTVANLIKAAFQNNLLDQYDGNGASTDKGTAYISIQNVNNPGSDVNIDQGGANINLSPTLGYDFLTTGSYGDSSDVLQQALKPYEDGTLNDGVLNTKYGIAYIPIKVNTYTPAYDVQHLPVVFVDSNNNVVGMIQNYSGKVGTTQNVNLTVPTGYKLADGASLPTSVTFQNSTDPLLVKVVPSGKTQRITNNTINVKFVDQESGQQVGTDVISLTEAHDGPNYYNTPAGYGADANSYHVDKGVRYETGIYLVQLGKTVYPDSPNGYDSRLANAIFSNLPGGDFNLEYYKGYLTVGYRGRKLDLSTDDLHYWHNLMLSVGKGGNDQGIDTKIVDGDVDTGKRSFTDNLHTISGNTVTVPVHKSTTYQFADPSGNAKSAQGNTVDVTLTKPQSVNPATDTRCQSQATRTIQINFPDGQIPDSYKDIVDSRGDLTQTVHFTRTATEDALTGNILSYGNWTSDNQDHNFIGFEARTLPRIPGYTLSIKPEQA